MESGEGEGGNEVYSSIESWRWIVNVNQSCMVSIRIGYDRECLLRTIKAS
jgi:hypothetical protein